MIYLIFLLLPHLVLATETNEKCDRSREKANSSFRAQVTQVSDGDTIVVKTSAGKIRRIRLLHIDTPETHYQGKTQGVAGDKAHERLLELLPIGSNVSVEFDDLPCDGYRRFLGRVIKDGREINLQMVREGFAASLCFAPNLARCEEYVKETRLSFHSKDSVFTKYKAAIPHEFRVEQSGRPEAPFVGSFKTRKVYPFARWKEIDGLDRVFFLKPEDVVEPYQLEQR
jgi:endonuclease YncB( thermonuclease family)